MYFKDETGKQYGKLTVIERAGKDRWGNTTWLCRCACGNEHRASGENLRGGNVKSCGCMKYSGVRLPTGEAMFKLVFRRMQANARTRGIDWGLNEDEVRDLLKRPCYYCGTLPAQVATIRMNHNGDYIYNGLDRIDNSLGYILGNVAPCCRMCNVAKNNHSLKQFKDWACRLYENWAGKEQGEVK